MDCGHSGQQELLFSSSGQKDKPSLTVLGFCFTTIHLCSSVTELLWAGFGSKRLKKGDGGFSPHSPAYRGPFYLSLVKKKGFFPKAFAFSTCCAVLGLKTHHETVLRDKENNNNTKLTCHIPPLCLLYPFWVIIHVLASIFNHLLWLLCRDLGQCYSQSAQIFQL